MISAAVEEREQKTLLDFNARFVNEQPEWGWQPCQPDRSRATALDRCPNRPNLLSVNRRTGQLVPSWCGANSCPYCVRRKVAKMRAAIHLAEPHTFLTFTLVPVEWRKIRDRYNTLARRLRLDGYRFETVYNVEPNPRGTGNHAHVWQHGDRIPSEHLNRRAAEVGFGHVHQEARYSSRGYAYGMKMTSGDELPEFLALNGRSLAHATRGFLA